MENSDDPGLIESIDAHIARTVAPVESVFHEIVSLDLHIDVHHVPPGPDRPFHTLVTSGMSEIPMETPAPEFDRYAEMCILLEPSWQLTQESTKDQRSYWPVGLLKQLARFPMAHSTWLGLGHTIINTDPPEPYAPNTRLCSSLIFVPASLPESFRTMRRADGQTTRFWGVIPLYPEELALKLDQGSDALIEALDAAAISDIVSPVRTSAIKPKRWWSFRK